MRARIVDEQQVANEERRREQQIATWNRRQMIEELKEQAVWAGAIFFVVAWMALVFVFLRTTETYRGLY
jgi:transposase